MQNIKKISLIVIVIMTILSFSNLLGLNIAGVSVIIGVLFFFINKRVDKQSAKESGLDLKAIGNNLKDKKIWFWILLPIIMDAIYLSIAKLYIPDFLTYETARAGAFVSFNIGLLSIIQLAFFALGEEIAWRAFFFNQLRRTLPVAPSLFISSLLFAFGHFSLGSTLVVSFSLIQVFINSCLYGIVFHKTNNAWISTISHFSANLFSIVVMSFL